MRRTAVLPVLLLLSIVSCRSSEESVAPGFGRPSIPPGYFDFPLSDADEISTVAEANLPYAANAPDGLGPAVRMITNRTTPPEPSVSQEIAWVYNHAVYGRFVILERAVDQTGAQVSIDELLAVTPGCSLPGAEDEQECNYAQISSVILPSGLVAVRLVGDVTTFVKWVEPATILDEAAFAAYASEFRTVGLLVEIIGPAGEFTPEEAAAVAALV